MKCPECQHNQRTALGLVCDQCQYHFTFNPKDFKTSPMTDGKFLQIIRAASQNGTCYFTKNQFYTAYCRRKTGSVLIPLIVIAVLAVIGACMLFAGEFAGIFFLIFSGLMLLAIYLNSPKRSPRSSFEFLVHKWKNTGKTIDFLIEKPTLHTPPPEWTEPDIYDYGVERVLIVERDILVDLQVKNGVHAEQRMLVLAESGYPEYLLPLARRILTEQPDVPVYLLHDATPQGADMKQRLLRSNLLPLQPEQVTDLGMFPEDFRKLKRFRNVDSANRNRTLPVDVLPASFLTMGLAGAMTVGTTFSEMIDLDYREALHEGGSHFG